MPSLLTTLLLVVAAWLVLAAGNQIQVKGSAGLGFAGLLGLNLALAVMALIQGDQPGLLHYLSLAAFTVLVVVPALLKRLTRGALRRGEVERARSLLQLRRMLQPGAGLAREQRILTALAGLRSGRVVPPDPEDDDQLPLAEQRLEPDFRLVLVEHLLLIYVVKRRWGAAVALFREEGGEPLAVASPGICASMVRAYSELGQLEEAARLLALIFHQLGRGSAEIISLAKQAQLVFLAHAGRTEQLVALLDEERGIYPGLPPAGRQVWLGVAHARSGDLERARAIWQEVLAGGDQGNAVAQEASRRLGDPPRALGEESGSSTVGAMVQRVMEGLDNGGVPLTRVRLQALRATPVTFSLVGLLVAIHIGLMASGGEDNAHYLRFGANFVAATLAGEPWRLLTSLFLHGSVLHLLFNVYALYALGRLTERLYGSARFWLVYVVSGVSGALASALLGEAFRLSVGASGAIFGLIGATLVGMVRLRGAVPESWRRQVVVTMLLVLGINLVIGLSLPNVDNAAHLGGLFGGLAASALLVLGPFATPGRLGHRAVLPLALVLALVTAVSGVTAARTPLETTLSRIPTRIYRHAGVEVRGPVYWLVWSTKQALFIRDPLMDVEGMAKAGLPSVHVEALDGDRKLSPARSVKLQTAELMAALRQVPGVTRVAVARSRRFTALLPSSAEVVQSEQVITLRSGERIRQLTLFRRHEHLLLLAMVRVPESMVSAYQPVARTVARSLSYSRSGAGGASGNPKNAK